MANLIEVDNLAVAFRGLQGHVVRAVDGISFAVPAGKVTALVGESGSGKSVTAHSILRLLPGKAEIGSGRISFHPPGVDTPPLDLLSLPSNARPLRALRGNRIGMIFQEPMSSLSPLHTIGDQISEVVRLHLGQDRQSALSATEAMLAKVGFPRPAAALRQYPFELSGGLRQRAMIAMALICQPDLLIADEPTTALDVTIQAQVLTLIRDLQRDLGMSVLLITHDLGVVANIADHVVVMYRGRIVESGPVDEIFSNPRHDYLRALFRAVPVIGGSRDERLTPLRPVEPGCLVKAETARGGAEAVPVGAPLLELRDIHKTYRLKHKQSWRWPRGKPCAEGDADQGVIRALDGINLDIVRGRCLGLVGESGCGKTSLSKIIVGALGADRGMARYHLDRETSCDLLTLDERQWRECGMRRRIQFVFQDPYGSLNPRMPVLDILTEPYAIQGEGDPRWRQERAVELMHLVGLDPRKLMAYPHSFSGGQRQRIGIARALALHPELLLCDEPVSALDVSVQAQILNLLKDLQASMGLTYLFVSHNLAVIDYMADRVAVMCKGLLVEVADRDELFANPTHPYTRALLAAVPEPRLDRKLDFELIRQGGHSDPAGWPAPFRYDRDDRPGLIPVSGQHLVRAAS